MIISHFFSSFFPAFFLLQEQAAERGSSLLDLILRASPVAQVVLLVLFLFSIASWAIIFAKARATKRARQHSAQFLQIFERSKRWSELHTKAAALKESPLLAIFLAANDELQKQSRLNLDAVQRVMQSAAISETTKLEQSLGWLASTASAAPFIGLFGTVVGIIIAFQGLSQAASASIQAVAPGIAEALVATAAGIAAAVPAVLGYNHYLNRVKLLAAEMDSFSLRLLNFIEREAAVFVQSERVERVKG
ncbi:MAG: MotA/TolQ/ExbB proton channel family protein [Acidobacteria bacterium]|nr:MotA/TolQ/ExbB proton channel family protein [Acidobacteriota bacterium]MCI0663338.1 MotA/TolQ/ExbB proton channel family protein [Acidobacteriota bacterium]